MIKCGNYEVSNKHYYLDTHKFNGDLLSSEKEKKFIFNNFFEFNAFQLRSSKWRKETAE